MSNPYTFAALVAVNQNLGWHDYLNLEDPEITTAGYGATALAVLCKATIYNVSYTSVISSIVRFAASPSNSEFWQPCTVVQASFGALGNGQYPKYTSL